LVHILPLANIGIALYLPHGQRKSKRKKRGCIMSELVIWEGGVWSQFYELLLQLQRKLEDLYRKSGRALPIKNKTSEQV
jgi:hypothetical protein